MIKGLDHIGIVVDNAEELGTFFKNILGIPMNETEELPQRKLKVSFYPIGDTDLELLEETSEGSTISDFLRNKGNGIQHLAFEVDDIDKAVQHIKNSGIEFIEKKPQIGARERIIIFIKPQYTNGVLIELCQPIYEN